MRHISSGTKWLAGVGLCLGLLGCGSREAGLDVAPAVVAHAKLGGELLFIDRTGGVVHAVDVMSKKLGAKAARIDIPANPILALERPSSAEVLVLCTGERDNNGEWVEPPALVAIDTSHQMRTYELSTPLSKVEVTTDGRYALLYAPDSGANQGDLLSNPNRVALVDLTKKPSSENPFERTLKAPGGALSAAYLTGAMKVAGVARPFGLFTFGSGISVWDLSHPERPEIASEGLGSGGKVALRKIVSDSENGTFYFIQQGLADLRVLDLNNAATDRVNDFWPSWNQLPLDSQNASDLVLYRDHDEPRVLVAVGGQVRAIDSNDSRVVPVVVQAPVANLYSFEGTAPNDTASKQRLLGWARGASAVTFIELGDLESRGTRNMELLQLGSAIRDVVALKPTQLLVSFEVGGIGVLDLVGRMFTPLTSTVELTTALIESDASRVWVGASGQQQIGYFEPGTLQAGSMRLDADIDEIFLFEKSDERRVVVSHASTWGQVTVVDAAQPSRSTATVLDGFLLDGLVKQ